ncbi:ATP-binding protein [Kineococcus sp. GCM10028916]|uniref:ATP-binding protein n=1 Tax=Kineococcus sp. GCM10028916 TaxID=3273394 RepID=UPI00363D15F4
MAAFTELVQSDLLWNPYDFANPVNDDSLFAGRQDELKEIRYYLRLAAKAPRPINLVLTGPRSAGKTSLLNKIGYEAKGRGFAVARIDLNEGDANPLSLFYKIYDAVLLAAVTEGAYAGIGGPLYRSYRTLIDGQGTSTESFTELLFPRHFALANQGGRMLSEVTLRTDLENIARELGKPCVLLFDECDVLAKSRIELEMLRNIFMNTRGYMLAFAGTPNLFPALEDVFSPIIRQFKKIPVEKFASVEDTIECITKPLRQLDIDPTEAFPETARQLHFDIHRLANGRPYEVQLLCHFMFKRVEEGKANRMAITVDVLDDVRRELETHEEGNDRRWVSALRRLSREDIQLLAALLECKGTIRQIWALSQIFSPAPLSLSDLESGATRFKELGLLSEEEGNLKFRGDQFDEIYVRYFAASREVALFVTPWEFSEALKFEVSPALRRISGVEIFRARDSGSSTVRQKIEEVVAAIGLEPSAKSTLPDITSTLYPSLLRSLDSGELTVAEVRITAVGTTVSQWVTMPPGGTNLLFEDSNIVAMANKTRAIGGELAAELFTQPLPTVEVMLSRIDQSASPRQLEEFASAHLSYAYDLHGLRNYEKALEQSSFAQRLHAYSPHATVCAHLSLLLGDWESASTYAGDARTLSLEEKSSLQGESSANDEVLQQFLLSTYDLAVARLMQGRMLEAAQLLQECIDSPDARSIKNAILVQVEGGSDGTSWNISGDLDADFNSMTTQLLAKFEG